MAQCHCCGQDLPDKSAFKEYGLGNGMISFGDRRIHLTKHEYMVMELLLSRRNWNFSKSSIMAHIEHKRGGDFYDVEEKIVDVYICKIRKKLKDTGFPLKIITEWGIGYRIDPAVSERVPEDHPGRGIKKKIVHDDDGGRRFERVA